MQQGEIGGSPVQCASTFGYTPVQKNAESPQLSIVIVEDTQDDVFFFLRSLKRTGIPCSYVHLENGRVAISHLEAHSEHPRLVFLDLKMPEVNGFEVLEWLKRQPFRGRLEIIVLTGSDLPEDINTAYRLGANGYLIKPVSDHALAKTIQEWSNKFFPDTMGGPAKLR
jgi:CheY-like chemotaxis protein